MDLDWQQHSHSTRSTFRSRCCQYFPNVANVDVANISQRCQRIDVANVKLSLKNLPNIRYPLCCRLATLSLCQPFARPPGVSQGCADVANMLARPRGNKCLSGAEFTQSRWIGAKRVSRYSARLPDCKVPLCFSRLLFYCKYFWHSPQVKSTKWWYFYYYYYTDW